MEALVTHQGLRARFLRSPGSWTIQPETLHICVRLAENGQGTGSGRHYYLRRLARPRRRHHDPRPPGRQEHQRERLPPHRHPRQGRLRRIRAYLKEERSSPSLGEGETRTGTTGFSTPLPHPDPAPTDAFTVVSTAPLGPWADAPVEGSCSPRQAPETPRTPQTEHRQRTASAASHVRRRPTPS